MKIDDVEAALRRMPLPSAPRSLREQVAGKAAEELARPRAAAPIVLRAPRPRFERLSLVGALLAAAAVLGVVLLPPSRPATPAQRLDELLASIRDPEAPGRARAVSALADMAGRKAMPVAASLLQDRDADVRVAAAELLCFCGATEIGVPALLREGRGFTVLNLLRSPDLWKAMAAARSPSLSRASAPERIREIALASGLELVAPGPSTAEERRWAAEGRAEKAPATLLAALESLLRFRDGSGGPYEAVLEKDRIRLLPRAEAESFWRAWWGK